MHTHRKPVPHPAMHRAAIATLAVALATLFAAPAGASDKDTDLLDRFVKQREKIRSLHMVTTTIVREAGGTREATVELWEQRQGDIRRARITSKTRTSAPNQRDGFEMETLSVIDGEHEWRETPSGDSVLVVKSAPSQTDDLAELRRMLGRAKVRLAGKETVGGEPCSMIEFVNAERESQFRATYWISDNYGLILKSVVNRGDRSKSETIATRLAVNEPIPSDHFQYEPPDGAQIIDLGSFEKPPARDGDRK